MGERVHVYQDGAGEYRWRKYPAHGGPETGASEEGYVDKAYAIERARAENPDAELVVDEQEDEQ
jgi:uncharacterized protein YegP (UPF0339 family)